MITFPDTKPVLDEVAVVLRQVDEEQADPVEAIERIRVVVTPDLSRSGDPDLEVGGLAAGFAACFIAGVFVGGLLFWSIASNGGGS